MAPEARIICSLLFLLLLLPHSTAAHSKSKPPARHQFKYQTLRATPLSPDPIARDDAAQPLFAAGEASILELDHHGTGNASTVRLILAHREAFAAPNVTASQLLAHRLERDAARAEAISASVSAAAASRNVTRSGGGDRFAAPVVSGLAQGSGEYFASVGVGTPPTPALLVLDTGSDVVWLQCAPCRRCYAQSGKVFDPRRSRSYAAVPCGAPSCRSLDAGGAGGCDRRRGTCEYQVAYGDGSVTAGDLATETLWFARGARVPRVAVGCGHDNEGLFVAAAGLLGLGRGRLSLPTQTARRYGRRFSYCLVDRTSSASLRRLPSTSSTLTFGAGSVPGRATTFTAMVSNPRMPTFYYVRVVGFSVGGARVRGVRERSLRLDPATGRGGVILDSGTSVSRLARPVYVAVRDAFRKAAAAVAGGGIRMVPGGFSLFDTCYDLRGRRVVKVPTVSVHLAGGAEVALPPENYLIPVDTRGTFCLALAGTDGGSGVSIVGNIQQQGFRVVFDGDRQRVAMVPKSC